MSCEFMDPDGLLRADVDLIDDDGNGLSVALERKRGSGGGHQL